MGLQRGDKRGINLYYEYREQLQDLTDEQKINILWVLLELDEKGEIVEEKERLHNMQNDKLAFAIFRILFEQQYRASTAWHNINKSQHPDFYDEQGRYKTHKGFDKSTIGKPAPVAKVQAEEKEIFKRNENVVSVDIEKGLLYTENNTYKFDPEKYPDMCYLEELYATISYNRKNEIIDIIPVGEMQETEKDDLPF